MTDMNTTSENVVPAATEELAARNSPGELTEESEETSILGAILAVTEELSTADPPADPPAGNRYIATVRDKIASLKENKTTAYDAAILQSWAYGQALELSAADLSELLDKGSFISLDTVDLEVHCVCCPDTWRHLILARSSKGVDMSTGGGTTRVTYLSDEDHETVLRALKD